MASEDIFESLETAVAEVLDDQCTIDQVQQFARAGGALSTTLRQQAVDLGWVGIAAPESAGGSGLGIDALVPIYRQLGAHLAPLPFLGQQLCIQALAECAVPREDRLAALVAGEIWGATLMSLDEPAVAGAAGADADGAGSPILDDGDAAWLLVLTTDEAGEAAVALRDITAAQRAPVRLHDATRSAFHLRTATATPLWLAQRAEARTMGDRLRAHAAIAIAADSVGGAKAILYRTVDYMKTREQFGRQIGSFQALKHRAASMKLKLESASALLRAAVAAWDDPDRGLALALLAKARACEAYVDIAADAIQLHGGIGFTIESPVHLYLKRAKLNQLMLGGDRLALDTAAALLVRAAA